MTTSFGSMLVYPFNFAEHLNEPHVSNLEEKTLGQVVPRPEVVCRLHGEHPYSRRLIAAAAIGRESS
jgi:hypothetical protein